MKKTSLYLSVAIFIGVLALSWLTHGTGVVTNDLGRNIFIPKELTMPLQVKAAYNGRDIFFRYRWPTRQPSIYHDMIKFEGGKWVRYGASQAGPEPQGIYEDRVTMFVDDGSVLAGAPGERATHRAPVLIAGPVRLARNHRAWQSSAQNLPSRRN